MQRPTCTEAHPKYPPAVRDGPSRDALLDLAQPTKAAFYASVLQDAGESIKDLAEYLGHSDPGLTLKVYAHLMPSSRERARKALGPALRPEDPGR